MPSAFSLICLSCAGDLGLFFGPVGAGENLKFVHAVGMIALGVGVTAGLVAVIQAVRKIPVQYAKRVVGRKVYGGQSSFMPLKVNYSGVMPVIFASAILAFPQQLISSYVFGSTSSG